MKLEAHKKGRGKKKDIFPMKYGPEPLPLQLNLRKKTPIVCVAAQRSPQQMLKVIPQQRQMKVSSPNLGQVENLLIREGEQMMNKNENVSEINTGILLTDLTENNHIQQQADFDNSDNFSDILDTDKIDEDIEDLIESLTPHVGNIYYDINDHRLRTTDIQIHILAQENTQNYRQDSKMREDLCDMTDKARKMTCNTTKTMTANDIHSQNIKEIKERVDENGKVHYVVVLHNSNTVKQPQNRKISEILPDNNDFSQQDTSEIVDKDLQLDKSRSVVQIWESLGKKKTVTKPTTQNSGANVEQKTRLSKYALGILYMNTANEIAMSNLYDTGGNTIFPE